jgi:hypothetical protein
MTINEYLNTLIPGVSLTSQQIESAILRVDGLTSGADVTTLTVATRELAEAEVLWMASRMISGGSYSKKVNNRQVSEAVGQATDAQRKSWADEANMLRRKNGLPQFKVASGLRDATHLWG